KEPLKQDKKDDKWDVESGDTFDEFTYKEEELNEAEGPAIYLTAIEELPTEEKEDEVLTETEKLDKLVQSKILTEEEKKEAQEFFRLKEPWNESMDNKGLEEEWDWWDINEDEEYYGSADEEEDDSDQEYTWVRSESQERAIEELHKVHNRYCLGDVVDKTMSTKISH
ncbi:9483_t:CDS:2, partial [Cetraspora pellucida]